MAPAIADRRPKYVTKSRVIQRHAEVSARCLFLLIADSGCGAFMSTRPNSRRRRRPTARRARRLPQEHCLQATGCRLGRPTRRSRRPGRRAAINRETSNGWCLTSHAPLPESGK